MNKRDCLIVDDMSEELQEVIPKEIVNKIDTSGIESRCGLIYDTKNTVFADEWKIIYNKKPMKSEDCLTVTIDIDPRGIDKPLILVARQTANGKAEIINEIDENVEDIYKILLGIDRFQKVKSENEKHE